MNQKSFELWKHRINDRKASGLNFNLCARYMRQHQNDNSYEFIDNLLPWSQKLSKYCRLPIQK
ncbi:hypothetical protein QA584_16525 [Anaerocolumna sp. AGMB13025]|uniref:hypothetical protein n=1 Tax=Anaerocolumna sp. AGMB13025 TaxID=3039116 RepID=UPI00241F9C48|nr:hypothetical protein [Anaerocolumna sp. AGMB13025]WFR55208.1 hypothetical protein QA584_16525 [Anaerocolumna sp. AGMB13025]